MLKASGSVLRSVDNLAVVAVVLFDRDGLTPAEVAGRRLRIADSAIVVDSGSGILEALKLDISEVYDGGRLSESSVDWKDGSKKERDKHLV